MSDANLTLVNLMIEEIQNRKNIRLVDEVFSEAFLNHTPVRGLSNDREGMRQLFSMSHAAFPDGVVSVQDQVSGGDKVWTRKTFTGTHAGPRPDVRRSDPTDCAGRTSAHRLRPISWKIS